MDALLLRDEREVNVYATALHWSLTQFTPAATDVQARNGVERTYSICVILLALLTFSSFVSSITTTMQSLHALQAARESHEIQLRSFFVENNISAELGTQVTMFLQKHHNTNGKRTHESDLKFLDMLPAYMKRHLREELHLPVLARMPFMLQLQLVDPYTLQRVAHTAVSQLSYHKGELMFSAGDRASSVWFLLEGMADYVHKEDERAMCLRDPGRISSPKSDYHCLSRSVSAGMWVGDPSLWLVWFCYGFLIPVSPVVEVTVLDCDACRKIMTDSSHSHSHAVAHARLFQNFLRGTTWQTDVWCACSRELKMLAKLSMTHKVIPE